ncbi:MAG: hypothetical protein BWY87_01527 [Deltaproteobacteria bacterium ADurb.Bin510]|nr:MAG: hypothetical protein BWY87_01527 [Deltaproteobacteria bacterium ADurb.Bin510]
MNVNFLNDKDKLLRERRRAALRRRLRQGLVVLILIAAAFLAWHSRGRLMAWLEEPAPATVPDRVEPDSAPKVEAQPQATGGTIYSWRDEHGVRTFSDRPPADPGYVIAARQSGRTELERQTEGPEAVRLKHLKAWLRERWGQDSSQSQAERRTNQ